MDAHVQKGAHPVAPKLILELYTPLDDDRPIYLTGSFNNWDCRDEQFRMKPVGNGFYQYHFTNGQTPNSAFEYKYLKGGWDAEELDTDGLPPGNRRMEVPRGKVSDVVPQWKRHANWYNAAYYPDIKVLSTRFNVPQLRRRRRVSVLLPWNYKQTEKRYPVLYLQDGQNLFEDDAPFGTWGVDKQLALLAEKGHGEFILVAIDHGGKERIKEYLPHANRKWGDALGREYASFLRETLKPYIDQHFRTLPDRANTGIGGSSMGGLISLYTGIAYPEVYSKFMIFSPSLWAAPTVYEESLRLLTQCPIRFHLYVGANEPEVMLKTAKNLRETLHSRNPTNGCLSVQFVVESGAGHNEAAWGTAFPKAATWLFG
jgi:predicted alpha/beta superfamily hydrolase